jgi:hypothetical protein
MHIARFIQDAHPGAPAPNGHTRASTNGGVTSNGHAGAPVHPNSQLHGPAAAGLNAFVNHGPGSPERP